MNGIELYQGDCLEVMRGIEDKSIDAIITDPPYGTTACKWDTIIPLDPMWEQLKRIIKPNGAIVLFGSQPFTSVLVYSNLKMFKYEWIWEKTLASNFALSKKQPQKKHENIIVFYSKQPTYNPQMEKGKPYIDKRSKGDRLFITGEKSRLNRVEIKNNGTRYPKTVKKISNGNNKTIHPTQKPVPLLEYLIKTYTNEGETVLDFTMGSGTTGVACKNLNRNFIGIEKDPEYFQIAKQRINEN